MTPRIGGSVGEAGGFLDRQRVHVGAQADRAVGFSPGQGRDDAVAADVGGEGDLEFGQAGLDEGGGLGFVQGQFRICVQVTAPLGQPVVQGVVHGASRAVAKPYG